MEQEWFDLDELLDTGLFAGGRRSRWTERRGTTRRRRGGFYLGRSICFFSVYLSVAICQFVSFGFDGGGAMGERAPGGSAPGERSSV
jgi:hypothetical protein